MKLTETPNRLINEKSPYLLQHAHNPVDWYPWSDEAFDKAKKEDKPIFLSIGYSTCHWCHVMERESFEDGEVAALLNENYVSVKVDREERPDIDTIYMSVCQAMTGHGGWPLTVIMTPEKKPFFAGTYFPKESKRGMPGLIDVLQQVTELWATERNKVLESGNQVTKALQDHVYTHLSGTVTEDTLDRAFECFERSFDPQYGGFGRAPKFPTPHNLSFLLRYWKLTGRGEALEMVEKTLDSMYLGGIYDHIGCGFARYSTDRMWLVPHFEKMLYDNALLAIAYTEAYQATGKEKYGLVAREIL
ncbi:MAG: thioredoxin domain-containing protein, partial [Firmicutes bacterium]|nr:thioredoxin domain-containing protein [Bacillota bacterium]